MTGEWIIFSTLNCPWCDKAKQLMDNNLISYQEIKVDTREKFLVLQEYSPMTKTVPVVIASDQDNKSVTLIGFPALNDYINQIKP